MEFHFLIPAPRPLWLVSLSTRSDSLHPTVRDPHPLGPQLGSATETSALIQYAARA